jgi:phosphate transport system protein
MPKRLQRDIEKIKKMVLSVGAMVEERIRMAIKAIETWDAGLAEEIIRRDYEIDELKSRWKRRPEDSGSHQPVAVDLRFSSPSSRSTVAGTSRR